MSLKNTYKIIFSKRAYKDFAKIGKTDAKRVLKKLLKLSYPFPANFDVDKMSGEKDFFRIRVGRTRTIFEVDYKEKEIWIRKIDYRGGVYKGNF